MLHSEMEKNEYTLIIHFIFDDLRIPSPFETYPLWTAVCYIQPVLEY